MSLVAWKRNGAQREAHISLAHLTHDGKRTLCGFDVPTFDITDVKRGGEVEPDRKPCLICTALDREGVAV